MTQKCTEDCLYYIRALGLLSVADWLNKEQYDDAIEDRDKYGKLLTQEEKDKCEETVRVINMMDGQRFFQWSEEEQDSFLTKLESKKMKRFRKRGFKND